MTDSERRASQADPRIQATLATREVPGHGDQFWHTLGTRLIAEREAPAAPTLDPLERLEQADRRPDRSEHEGSSRRRDRKERRTARHEQPEPVPPTVSQLAEHAGLVRQRQPDWRRQILVTSCVVSATMVIAVALWLGVTAKQTSPVVTASQVAGPMSRRLAGARYILGGVTRTGLGDGNGRFAFVRSSEGSFRYRGLDQRSDSAYDAVTGVAQRWHLSDDGVARASEDTGLAAGPPDTDGASRFPEDDELAAILQMLDASPTTLARSRTLHGREVWIIDVQVPPSSDDPIDHVRVVIDQRRYLPLEISRSVAGTVIETKRFSGLRFTSSVRPSSFRLTFPGEASPDRFDHGFRQTRLSAADQLIAYQPVTPEWLPPGYELSSVAVLAGTPPWLEATAGGDNPPNRDVVSVAYRRGVQQITVTTRRVSTPTEHWKDPFPSAGRAAGRVQRLRLDGGRFLGTAVEQVSLPGGAPHLWGRTTDFVFTVAGGVDPSELARVASSLN